MNAHNLSVYPGLEECMAAMADAAYDLPIFMKIKATQGIHGKFFSQIPDLAEEEFRTAIADFAECMIPGLALFDWSQKSPALGSILTEILLKADAVAEMDVDEGEADDNGFLEVDSLVKDRFICSLSMTVLPFEKIMRSSIPVVLRT